MPTALRGMPSVLVTREGTRILFDCGEGTQRQLRKSTGLVQVDEIYLTHFHLDHCLGIPGLLKTWDLNERAQPLRVFGPGGMHRFMDDLRPLIGRLGYHVEVEELAGGDVVGHPEFEIEAFETEHRTRALGYALLEDDRPGRLDPALAADLGVTDGPALGALQRGETVEGDAGEVAPDQVMGPDRPGRSVVITGDTAPCQNTLVAAADADLLIHDSSFLTADRDRADETGHSTAAGAAELAAEARVEMLALVHISARYHVGVALEEAREAFPNSVAPRDFDLIEIPLPEKGKPRHVREGAIPKEEDPGE